MPKINCVTHTIELWVDEYPDCNFCGEPIEHGGAHDATGEWQVGTHVHTVFRTDDPTGWKDGPLCEGCAEDLEADLTKKAEHERAVDARMAGFDDAITKLRELKIR